MPKSFRKNIFFSLLGGAVAISAVAATKSHDAALARNLNTFNYLVKQLELNYVDSIRTDEAFEAAIGAMLSTIDPYTEFYNEKEKENLFTMTTGEYGGIGSYIMQRDGSTYISGPMDGSPAKEVGLKSGDKIIRVDTVSTVGKGSSEVTKLLRGQPGTKVEVEVLRPFAADSILTFTLERRKLQQPSVPYYGVVGGNTGYISITSFIDKTPAEVKKALDEFKQNPNVKNIILDLRSNGGGLLETAVETVGYFVPKGTEVVRTSRKNGSSEKIYKTTHSPIFPDIPVVVLVDGNSASAAEITAGAFQDLDRGLLVGTRTFGKGLVQNTLPLPNETLLKVTVGKYYTPSGRLLQAIDYSRRNPDGSVARTPDSLTRVYKTLHGREVRDGGGLTPDVTVSWGEMSRILYNIIADHWAFDFATKYAAEHDAVPAPEEFEITDEIFDNFKKSINPEKFKYDKVCEEMMVQLRKTTEREGYMNDSTKAAIEQLSKLLTHNLDHDLDTHRKDISEYLGDEIISRFYDTKGKIVYNLKSDVGVSKALEILNDPARYKELLTRIRPEDNKEASEE